MSSIKSIPVTLEATEGEEDEKGGAEDQQQQEEEHEQGEERGHSKGSKRAREGAKVIPEWSMVELQGEIKCSAPLSGQLLGHLSKAANGNPTLIINNNKMEGKVTSLPKPMLVFKRIRREPSPQDSTTSRGEEGEKEGGATQAPLSSPATTSYSIVGRVESKMHFKNRPRPIMNSSQKT